MKPFERRFLSTTLCNLEYYGNIAAVEKELWPLVTSCTQLKSLTWNSHSSIGFGNQDERLFGHRIKRNALGTLSDCNNSISDVHGRPSLINRILLCSAFTNKELELGDISAKGAAF